MIRALLIDFDGTLVESTEALRKVLDAFLRANGAVPAPGEFDRMNGPPLSEVVGFLARKYGLSQSHGELLNDYRRRVAAVYSSARSRDGARELLEFARRRRLATGIVTSNDASLAQSWLTAQGLNDFVDCIIDPSWSRHGKPNPEPYEKALAHFGAASATSFAVEDSPPGAEAARGAGLRTFVLGNTCTTWPDGCDFVVSLHAVIDELSQL